MRIYNKKGFWTGVFMLALALLLAWAGLRSGFQDKIFAILVCVVCGVSYLFRGLSYEMSREDRVEEQDERERFVRARAQSRALQITQVVCFALMLAFVVMGAKAREQMFVAMGVAAAFCYMAAILSELFTQIYYQRKY